MGNYERPGAKMITYKELLSGNNVNDVSIAHQHNLEITLKGINIIRAAYGKIMKPTNAYRSMQDHLRIYSQKGITDPSEIPMRSKHLAGLAVDIYDPNKELYNWCKNNPQVMDEANVWLEERQGPWQHFQFAPFGSYRPGGSRWFNP